jgi:PKD repeat protein
MKYTYLIIFSVLVMSNVKASRNIFWSEKFDQSFANCLPNSSPFSWTVTNVGSQGTDANDWYIFYPANNQPNSCCTLNPDTTQGALFIGYGNSTCDSAEFGPVYKTGCDNITNKRVSSPTIDCSGRTNITLDLDIVSRSIFVTDFSCILISYDGGSNWDTLESHVYTGFCISSTLHSFWNHRTFLLSSSADNNANVKIGFTWKNDDDCKGTTVSVAIDNIQLSVECTNVRDFHFIDAPYLCINHTYPLSADSLITGMTYAWDFGNNTTDSGATTSATYLHPGNYTITLIAIDSNGCESITSKTVNVGGFDITITASDTEICPNNCVTFSPIVSPSTILGAHNQYNWNFRDDQSGPITSAIPTFCFTHAGDHVVTLMVSNRNTQCPINKNIIIHVDTCNYPVLNIITASTGFHICKNTCISFGSDAYDATSYSWSFPGGIPSSSTSSTPPIICYNIPGTFNVTLTITNSYGSTTRVVTVLVDFPPPVPSITFSGGILSSNLGPPYTFQWYLDAGGYWILPGDGGDHNEYEPVAYHGYNYKLVVTNGACSTESSIIYVPAP